MKLQQGQVWKREGEFLRIVALERLNVEYKSQIDLASKDGTHHRATKKEFCRLLKNAVLFVSPPAGRETPTTVPVKLA